MTIGQLAARTGVGVETLRFYEREGLLQRPPRRASGYRDYPADAVRRVRFIRHARALGFPLGDIAELLALRADPNRSCARVRARAEARLAEIEEKLRALRRMKRALEALIRDCEGRGSASVCPILDALDHEEKEGLP